MSTWIASAAELGTAPDGTIISWLRIPGDETSEAMAFVRQEIEDLGPCGPFDESGVECGQRAVTWISPGGWAPHSIQAAGVTFPCRVIRWGTFDLAPPPKLIEFESALEPMQAFTLDAGGSHARMAALDAAVQLFRGDTLYVLPRNGEGPLLGPVLETAKAFEEHLLRDDLLDATVIRNDEDDDAVAHAEAFKAWLDRDRAAEGEPTDIVTDDGDMTIARCVFCGRPGRRCSGDDECYGVIAAREERKRARGQE